MLQQNSCLISEQTLLFVISHKPGAEVVERFSFDVKNPTFLVHEETIAAEFM